MRSLLLSMGIALAAAFGVAPGVSALTLGQLDTFEDGTTQGWAINLLGMGAPPAAALPTNVPTGGPDGADDAYLRLTSTGAPSGGGRLVALNAFGAWAGDYPGAGVTGIAMDVRNFGASDVLLRVLLEDPGSGPPANVAISSQAILVPAGGDWARIVFPLAATDLAALLGSVDAALANTTVLRILHAPTAVFPAEPIAAQIGIDDVRAVPEPGTALLVALGTAALARRRA
ncbi:MAG: hypothetical protein DCC71_23825 [Proteobacteria bacterium]|nr:MAG: hypothetical protein DCC71_23825 [Pseudomonadota bacterium]